MFSRNAKSVQCHRSGAELRLPKMSGGRWLLLSWKRLRGELRRCEGLLRAAAFGTMGRRFICVLVV